MKFLFAIILALFTACLLTAQHIAVKSFRMLENDLDARVNFPRKDQNGDVCALIKAVTTETGFDWDGDQLGIVKTLQKKGEIWIYVPFGAKRITISHAALGVLRNYAYPLHIEKAAVYEMALTTGKVVTVVQEEKIKTVWLAVSGNPPGADVYINEVWKGSAHYTEKMKPGKYDYRVEKTLYHSESGTMEITGDEPYGKKEISVALKPAFGYLQIDSEPENGAGVFIDNVELTEKTPCKSNMLSSGTHRVTCRLNMYQPKSMDILIEDGQTAHQTMTLTPHFSVITIASRPPADIYIDGVKAGEGKYTGRILPGLHTIEGKLAQHESDEQDIETIAGKDTVIHLALRPTEGNVYITSDPADANVYINDVLKGATPLMLNKMPAGVYQLSLKKTGFETVSKNIEVREGKAAAINETLRADKEEASAGRYFPWYARTFNPSRGLIKLANDVADFAEDGCEYISTALSPRREKRREKKSTHNTYFALSQVSSETFTSSSNLKFEARVKVPEEGINDFLYRRRRRDVQFSLNCGKAVQIKFVAFGNSGLGWMRCGDAKLAHLPELCVNFDSRVTLGFELKNGTMSALINGAVVKTMDYTDSSTGEVRDINIEFEGGGSVDWLRIYQDGALKLDKEFNADKKTTAGLSD